MRGSRRIAVPLLVTIWVALGLAPVAMSLCAPDAPCDTANASEPSEHCSTASRQTVTPSMACCGVAHEVPAAATVTPPAQPHHAAIALSTPPVPRFENAPTRATALRAHGPPLYQLFSALLI
jgi:hypothetical protein